MGFVIEPLKTKSEKCAVEYKTGRGDHVVERVRLVNTRFLINSRAYYFARVFTAKQKALGLLKVCENRKEQSGIIETMK